MNGYNIDHMRAEHRHRLERLSQVVDKERLLRGGQVYQRRLYQQALAKAGDWLIAAGTTLKERTHQPQMNTNWQV